jgi:NitT/TauT family transport system permease protein
MKAVLPVLTVVAIIVALWYAAAVWMNAAWVYDQAERAEQPAPGFAEMVPQTMNQERPVLPPPHQVGAELWKGLFGQAVTSKRSLVYHGFVTFKGTMMGFALGIVFGSLLAMAIVRFRVMDMSVMPWAIISQTVPIVALAPMIITVSNQVGLTGARCRRRSSRLSVVLPGAGQHGQGVARARPDAAGPVEDLWRDRGADLSQAAAAGLDAVFLRR